MKQTKFQVIGSLILKALKQASKTRDEIQAFDQKSGIENGVLYRRAQDVVEKLNAIYTEYRRDFE